jgi:tetratricopeptide (TPR) repeat protein
MGLFAVIFLLLFSSCTASPASVETPLPTQVSLPERAPQPAAPGNGGIAGEVRSLTEKATPSSLLGALDIIRLRSIGSTEFGRIMNTVNAALLTTLYPAVEVDLPPPDPPITHVYSRILQDIEKGIYTTPRRNSDDFLEHVLPFLSLYPNGRNAIGANALGMYATGMNVNEAIPEETFVTVLGDLEIAGKLNGESVLPGLFSGVLHELRGFREEAAMLYSEVWENFPECFPAALGITRIMAEQGRGVEAEQFLSELLLVFPDNIQVKRQQARVLYNSGDWLLAEAAADEILRMDSRNREFLLMKAHILVELGQLLQAQAPLEAYAVINPNNRLYLFLRARVQAEAYNNIDTALNYLRSILRIPPAGDWLDDEVAIYAARLMMESPALQDNREGRELLARLLAVPVPSLEAITIAMGDAVRREAWGEARRYLTRLLEERRSSQDLLAAFSVEREQGNRAAALSYARELYDRDRLNEEGTIAYITALIDSGYNGEASGIIQNRLDDLAGGVFKSRFYYLHSLTRTNEELKISDLRSSLFEDPRNLDAIIALFEIYHRRGDERRAVFYLRQALALAPDDQRLRRYEAEYSLL